MITDLSHRSEGIFALASHDSDLYLRGEMLPGFKFDFGASYNGEHSVVPFKVQNFATREIFDHLWPERKNVLDEWVGDGGLEAVDRFVYSDDLTAIAKRGRSACLFVNFPDNYMFRSWTESSSLYIPADSIRRISF